MTKVAQNWLDTKYPNKTVGGKIEVYDENVEGVEELTGELLIENYVNVEEIDLERQNKRKSCSFDDRLKGQITKVIIKNCPKLKELGLNNNKIKEIIFEGEFPDLVQIDSIDNKLTEIDISKAPKLEWLAVTRNPITKIKGLEYATQLRNVILIDSPGFNGREYGEWKDAIKDILNVPLTDPLPDTWKTDLKTKLDGLEGQGKEVENERKKVQDYENDLKNALGLKPTDPLPTDWQNKLAKKDDLVAAQNGLKEWTDKFLNKSPDEVDKENKKAVDDLQKELNDLKSKPASTTPTAEQQQKIDNLIKLIEKQNQAIEKLGKMIKGMGEVSDWENQIVDISKIK